MEFLKDPQFVIIFQLLLAAVLGAFVIIGILAGLRLFEEKVFEKPFEKEKK